MDLDLMWGAFTRYRPMLDEMFAEWSAQKEKERLMANARRTLDGRVLTEEEVAANDTPPAAIPGRFVAPGAHAMPTRTFEAGSDEELDRLREIADERGVDYDKRWRGPRMREELGFAEDEGLPVGPGAAEPPAHAPGEGATASGDGGQDNPPGAGHTASGTGGQDNPARTGHTASGLGGQDNPGTQAQVLDQPRGQERQERGGAQARDKK